MIGLDDFELPLNVATPIEIQGKHSRKALAGLSVRCSIPFEREQKLRDLFQKDEVNVRDPFKGRKYAARIREKSCSYRDGDPERAYEFDVREIDRPPDVTEIEIEGRSYEVLRYEENDPTPETIGIHCLVKMSPDEFRSFQELCDQEEDVFQVKRKDVDDVPVALRCGGRMPWSKHGDGGPEYYKQVVRFFPQELKPGSPISLTTDTDLIPVATLALKSTLRVEALVKALQDAGVLSDEKAVELLGPASALLSESRREEISWECYRLPDAEATFR
jgi:hypothetical protein